MQPDHLIAGRYRLLDRIGAGAMGEVWRARDTTLEREVAVKVVDLSRPSQGSAAARFRREATATAGLHHPNVVQIFDAGFDDPEAYIVMELLTGPALSQLIGKVDVRTAVRLTAQIASGLAAAHRVGVLHRDIKPGNIMLDHGRPGGVAKVVDFGIARLLEDTTEGALTQTHTAIGTAAYMSPEQATGAELTPASDIYSLGCLLFALLTGRPPYSGEHPLAVLQQHVFKTPPRPSDLDPALPSSVDALVSRMMSRQPADRPSATDVVSLCDRILGPDRGGTDEARTIPLAADLPTARERVVETQAEPSRQTAILPAVGASDRDAGRRQPPERPRPTPRNSGRRSLGWIIAALLVLIALLIAALLVLRPWQGTPGETVSPTTTPTSATGTRPTSATAPTGPTAPTAARTTSAPTPTVATSPPETTAQQPTSPAATTSAPETSAPNRASPGGNGTQSP